MHKAWFGAGLAAVAIAPLLGGVACSDSDTVAGAGGQAVGGSGTGNTGTGADAGNLFPDGGDAGCIPGDPCGDGGVCTGGGVCCEADNACGESCCADAEICSFQQCVTPGGECVDATDCGPDEYCEYSLGEPADPDAGAGGGCVGGVVLATGRCLPRPPECGPNEDPGDPPHCLVACEYQPPPGQFSPELKFAWGDPNNVTHRVMMAPVVIQLDDDNCDDKVDEKDIPEIVFFTFDNSDYNNGTTTASTLRAISIVGGQVVEKWSVKTNGTSADAPGRSIAAGNIDGNDGNEIVVCTRDGRVRAYDANGGILWLSAPIGSACFMPSIADIDQDGVKEVITRMNILNGQSGVAEATLSPANTPDSYEHVVVSDVDGDGVLDVVGPGKAYRADGSLIIDTGYDGDHPAVGDLDNDGIPEIVAVHFDSHSLAVWHIDPNEPGGFKMFRQGLDMNATIPNNPCCAANPNSAGCTRGGGPPTIADFNGDGFPDVGLAGGIGYVVFDGPSLLDEQIANVDTIMWLTLTQDCSSAMTGSSVFDFDGDGQAEVVYADEIQLHIYDGATGNVLFETCNTSGTLWEYPLVADVDNDSHADIIVASNSYNTNLTCNGARTTGIRVFGDTEGKWVRTRRIWNEHPYHVTNVEENGNIPVVELPNYLQPRLNNFRQNVQPLGEFSAPDLVVDIFPKCFGDYGLIARVRNIGEASVPPGVAVGFYEGQPGSGTLLGTEYTTQALYSLGSEDVILSLAAVPAGRVYAVVDDGNPPHPWHECRTNNNVSDDVDPDCATAH